MTIPHNLHAKFLNRFDKLIEEGNAIYDGIRQEPGPILPVGESAAILGAKPRRGASIEVVDQQALTKWKINYRSLLDHILPQNSIHRKLINEEQRFFSSSSRIQHNIAVLQAIRDDFNQGFLQDIGLQIEAELAADYLGQAEQLLSEGQSGKFDHVPAAVLCGAVLEKSLRTLCSKQTPPISTTKANGDPLTMNPLIDILKKAGVFNELKAKQLRAWADIRNAAAHGKFQEFQRSDVEQMLSGVNDFLASHMT